MDNIYNDYNTDRAIENFTTLMSKDRPYFFSRIGGSDYMAIVEYFSNKNLIDNPVWLEHKLDVVRHYNGYFDFGSHDERKENFRRYLEDMISFYKDGDDMSYAGSHLIYQFETRNFNHEDKNFLQYMSIGKDKYQYAFIEQIKPFLQSFSIWGKDKKILIISPFSKSIQYQFERIDKLYLNYQFPNIELLTYNTPITYSTPSDTKESLNISTNNWHEECQRILNDIKEIDFDIAFLSCASYSMFLGTHIKAMGKKSIYMGGIINVFFNIWGDRYDDFFYEKAGLNLDYLIDPFENEDIQSLKGGRSMKGESLNAYFGKRNK